MRGYVDISPPCLAMISQMRLIPKHWGCAAGQGEPAGTCDEVGHLDKRMQLAVLQDSAPHKPFRTGCNIGLATRELTVEAICDQLLSAPKRTILSIDDQQGESGPRRIPLLNKGGVDHPEPEAVSIGGVRRRQRDRKNSNLRYPGDVL